MNVMPALLVLEDVYLDSRWERYHIDIHGSLGADIAVARYAA